MKNEVDFLIYETFDSEFQLATPNSEEKLNDFKRNIQLNPMNPSAACLSVLGPRMLPTTKLKMAATMMANKKFCAFVSHSIPTAQITIMTAKAMAPTIRISFAPPSMIFRPKLSTKKYMRIKICENHDKMSIFRWILSTTVQLTQQIIERTTKTDGIHWSGNCVCKRKYNTNRSTEFGAQWPRNDVVNTATFYLAVCSAIKIWFEMTDFRVHLKVQMQISNE